MWDCTGGYLGLFVWVTVLETPVVDSESSHLVHVLIKLIYSGP